MLNKDEKISELQEINTALSNRLNAALLEIQQRDSFVREFATEYGLATYGRPAKGMWPGLISVELFARMRQRIGMFFRAARRGEFVYHRAASEIENEVVARRAAERSKKDA